MYFDNWKDILYLIGFICFSGFLLFSYFYAIFKEARETYRFNKALTLLLSDNTETAFNMLIKAESDWFINTYRGRPKVYIENLQMLKTILENLRRIAHGRGCVIDIVNINRIFETMINICSDKNNIKFCTLGNSDLRYDYTCWLNSDKISEFEQLQRELAEARELFRKQLKSSKSLL